MRSTSGPILIAVADLVYRDIVSVSEITNVFLVIVGKDIVKTFDRAPEFTLVQPIPSSLSAAHLRHETEMTAASPADPWDDDTDRRPTAVTLAHGIFRRFPDAHFQRAAGDGMPVLMVQLSDAPASLPLRGIQREFAIADDSPDGIVLGMICEALDFVGVLRIGDRFPPEVLSGDASWQPDQRHFELASARLKNALVAWHTTGAEAASPPPQGTAARPAGVGPHGNDAVLTDAFRAAAAALNLARPEEAVALVEELARELAHIEFLREHLIVGMIRMQNVLQAVLPQLRADRNRSETVAQVGRLLAVALERTRVRFDEIDAQTAGVIASLGSLPAQRAFIRSTRDFLHRSWHAFEPILSRWMAIDPAAPAGLRGAIDEAYAFLAPRYMAVQEWLETGRRIRAPDRHKNHMEW